MRPTGHLARSVLAAVCAAPIDVILLVTERGRLLLQDWLSAAACLWSALAAVCFWGAA